MQKGKGHTGVEIYDTAAHERVLELGRAKYRSLYNWQRVKQTLDLLEPLDLRDKVVLEIGPGSGEWALEFLRRGATVAIMDVRAAMVAAVRELAGMHGLDPGAIRASVGPFPEAEPPVAQCDLLFAKDVIEHIPDERAMWEGIRRLVRPGGHVILATQNSRSLNYAVQAPRARFIRGERNWCGWDPTHVRFYTASRLRGALIRHGFGDVHFAGAHHLPFKLRPLSRLDGFTAKVDLCDTGASEFLRAAAKTFHTRHKLLVAAELSGLNKFRPFSCVGWSIAVRARKTAP